MTTSAAEATAIPAVGATKTFTIPERARQAGDPKTITLRTSFAIQTELEALKVSPQGGVQSDYELLQRIIVKMDNKPVDQGRNFMETWSPKVRMLALRALNTVMIPTGDETKDFLESGTIDA